MKKYRILIILAIIISTFSILFFSCSKNGTVATLFGNLNQSPLKNDSESTKSYEIQKTFRKIFDLYKEKVVFITTERFVRVRRNPFYDHPFFNERYRGRRGRSRLRKRKGLGTGFIISEDGYICTNHHVIKGVDGIKIKVMEKTYEADVVGYDKRTDLALLKINAKKKLKPVYFGDSDKVKVGDWAVAIGNPFGLDKTFTVGVVSAIGRNSVDLMGGSHIQTDASINPGNSGGPLINIFGEVIGINRMIYSKSGGYMGIGFAIPVNIARNVLDQLKKYRKVKWGYIGVSIVKMTEEYAQELGLKEKKGAFVGEVMEGSPASKGGIRIGDVILKMNNKNVRTYKDVLNVVGMTKIGKTVKVVVWRKRRLITVFVTVKERPSEGDWSR